MQEKPLITLTVPENLPQTSINHIIKKSGISQTLRRRLRSEGFFEINGLANSWNTLLSAGDEVKVYFQKEQVLTPWEYTLDIVFEDDHLLVLNKPAGLLMHPTSTERIHTLANAIIAYYEQTGQKETATFHPIHRLDKDTSGLVVIAKNSMVQHAFTHKRIKFQKVYEGLVEGNFPSAHLSINWPIGRKHDSIIQRCVTKLGKHAQTDILCLKKGPSYSLVRFLLLTGRTHQIRVHTSHLGYPLLGDDLYGGTLGLISRQALHATALSFAHPITGDFLNFSAPLPKDIQDLVNQI